jgi:omega-6 fatty acid desaturase (delta-12 desaturase)
MTECDFNWRMLKNIITECHIYDKEKNYVPFDYEKEAGFLAVQRRVLPESM